MIGFPKSEENLDANEHGYHIFGQNIKYQHEQKVMINKKYLHTVNPKQPILAYTSSVGEIGMISESFYRSGNNGAFQGLFFKFEKYNKSHMLYIMCTLKKQFKYFGYATGMADILSLSFDLPIDKSGEIAFDYMEAYIKELEAERIKELEAYLVATGLNDYVLSDDEKQVIAKFKNNKVTWGEFKYRDLFDHIVQGRRLKKDDQTVGDLPFVMSGTTNSGIVGKIGNITRIFPKNSLTIDIFGSVFYRNYVYGMGDDTGAYWNEKNELSKFAMLYIAASISKSLSGKYDYGNKLRSSRTFDFIIKLPMKSDQNPDYELMSRYIHAIEKIIIKGVVEWKDKQIKATRKVVSKNNVN